MMVAFTAGISFGKSDRISRHAREAGAGAWDSNDHCCTEMAT